MTDLIERAEITRVNDILHVINTSNREMYQSITPPEHFQDPYVSLDELRQNFEEMVFYVYEHQEKIVGVVALDAESPEVGKIHYLYVLPHYQRNGVGSALVIHVQKLAQDMGLKTIKLHVGERADWATNFYEKLGFDAIDRLEHARGITVVMAKELRDYTATA